MAKLILHVGPGKCGSSSIQHFFATNKTPCIENIIYSIVSAVKLNKLNCDSPEASIVDYFRHLLSKSLINDNVLILSQEYFFEAPLAIKHLCQLAQDLADEISIIGYCRQQSKFLVSQYSQWLFRTPKRIIEVNKYVTHLGLDADLFTGLEKQLIASISNDFQSARMLAGYTVHDWQIAYQTLSTTVSDIPNTRVYCGLLPKKDSNSSLIEDFCDKAKLTLKADACLSTHQISNPSFSPDIVEAINNAITHNYEMPGPHEHNQLIASLSSQLSSQENSTTDFLNKLKLYIDAYYAQSNQSLCDEFKLDKHYFSKPNNISKTKIMSIIEEENQNRSSNKSKTISDYRLMTAKLMQLCIELSKKE